jgi:hypothetical protein
MLHRTYVAAHRALTMAGRGKEGGPERDGTTTPQIGMNIGPSKCRLAECGAGTG